MNHIVTTDVFGNRMTAPLWLIQQQHPRNQEFDTDYDWTQNGVPCGKKMLKDQMMINWSVAGVPGIFKFSSRRLSSEDELFPTGSRAASDQFRHSIDRDQGPGLNASSPKQKNMKMIVTQGGRRILHLSEKSEWVRRTFPVQLLSGELGRRDLARWTSCRARNTPAAGPAPGASEVDFFSMGPAIR